VYALGSNTAAARGANRAVCVVLVWSHAASHGDSSRLCGYAVAESKGQGRLDAAAELDMRHCAWGKQTIDQEMMVKQAHNPWRTKMSACLLALLVLPILAQMLGCEVDSYFDPSRTGRFQHTPTTIPILDRIDVIEQEDQVWGQVTSVQPQDLMPSDLSYTLAPGDFLTVELYELFAPRQWTVEARRIDSSGMFRIPEIGDIVAAGLTVQEFEDVIIERLSQFLAAPRVNVVLEEGRAFTYTIYGFVANSGMYTLRDPNLRLIDALAIIGGVPLTTDKIYIIREVPLTEDVRPFYQRDRNGAPRTPTRREDRPVDIDDLIEQLEDQPQPGVMHSPNQRHLVDLDDVAPVRVATAPPVDLDDIREQAAREQMPPAGSQDAFIYVEERGEWVRTRAPREQTAAGRERQPQPEEPAGDQLFVERVIEIPWQRLSRGDSSYNVVIRPNDRIYVEGPTPGLVYISGEIARPGVYDMPQNGGRLTLSRLVAAAGDLGPIAIPERVDLTRIVGPGREATVRVNLAAIRRRTEPDLYLKPNDHIIIGTSWVATPLAVIRNGFRATYGFGFLLDRNFGNDVFGAPPLNRVGQ
jgi:polysaccharide export outer membrane protein